MKKYGICFLIILAALLLGFAAGYGLTRRYPRYEEPIPNATFETETVPENRVVINQDWIEPAPETLPPDRFLLVSETGYLLVFEEGDYDECMQTHIPITDFPEEEQSRLREGIWFDSMMEVFFYLESYTS